MPVALRRAVYVALNIKMMKLLADLEDRDGRAKAHIAHSSRTGNLARMFQEVLLGDVHASAVLGWVDGTYTMEGNT
jgi:hypothetical protein